MTSTRSPREGLPPRFIIRLAWAGHRLLYRLTRGRRPLKRPTGAGSFGILRLRVRGRVTGQERIAIVCYIEDGDRLVTLAMNGWDAADPAWWTNLLANPDAEVDLVDGVRPVHARRAEGDERHRLWRMIDDAKGWGDIDRLSLNRPDGTSVVVLEARS